MYPLGTAYIQWTDKAAKQPRFIKFDVVETESHTLTSEITEHPIEDGANIADHIRQNLDEVKLEVLISGSPITAQSLTWMDERASMGQSTVPLDYSQPLGDVQPDLPFLPTPGALFGAVTNAIGGLLGLNKGRPESAMVLNSSFPAGIVLSTDLVPEMLRDLKEKSTLVEVVTPLRVYEDMALISVEIPRKASDGNSVRVTLTFKHVRRVQSKLVSAPAASIKRAEKTADKGKQDGNGDDSAAAKTLAKGLADRYGGNPARGLLGGH